MKPFPPTLRERKRYLKFEIISDSKLSEIDVKKAVARKIFELLGTLGVAKSGFKFFSFDEKTQLGELKTNNESVDLIKACTALIDEINEVPVIVNVERTSGTLKALRNK